MSPTARLIWLCSDGLATDTLERTAAVLELGYPNIEVVVIDNGSADNSAEVIRRIHPNVTLLDNKKNLGYAGGNNVGIKYRMERGVDYLGCLTTML